MASVSDAARTVIVVQPSFIKIQTVVVRARANSALERTPLRGDAQLSRWTAQLRPAAIDPIRSIKAALVQWQVAEWSSRLGHLFVASRSAKNCCGQHIYTLCGLELPRKLEAFQHAHWPACFLLGE